LRLLPRRALVAIGLAISFVAAAAPPAQAAYYAPSDSVRAANRPRSGASVWAPRYVDFTSGWDQNAHSDYMTFGFQWSQDQHIAQMKGSSQFLEISAEVDCAWARVSPVPNTPHAGDEGYSPHYGLVSNIPSAALPYEDTDFGEYCVNSNTDGRGNFGFGVLNAALLVPGTLYWVTVQLDDVGFASAPINQSSVKLRIGTGTVYDSSQVIPPQLGSDCNFSDAEIANWKAPGGAALNTRLQASWCAWQDWNHTIVKDDVTLMTGQYKQFNTDKLYNQGMEGTAGYVLSGTGSNWTSYCNDPFPSYDGSCFIEFNRGSSATMPVIYQDSATPVQPGGYVTTESAVRCRKGAGQTCDFQLGFWAYPSGQVRMSGYTIPDDGGWYICRQDTDHGQGASPIDWAGQTSIRWAIVNWSGANMDVDYTFLGGKTNVNNPAPGDNPGGVGHITAGNPCTRR
jgi:hypothetical protein